ncbi:MAG: molybdate ABC transporter substrate-binding protein [Croceibacterium sp.]
MTGKMSLAARAAVALVLATLLAACGSPSGAPQRGPIVLAASSVQESLQEVADLWTAQRHSAPVLSFAATSALARQVQQGAPADIFLSADEEWADRLAKAKLLRAGTRRDLLTNTLVLVRPHGGAVSRLNELGTEKLALADPEAVPAGKYAKASLENQGLWTRLAPNIVLAENVRAALVLVERGEAALGIVYATDAKASTKVEVLATLPPASHPPIRYPVAVMASSTHPDAAAFSKFLSTPEARAIFERHGFGIAR